MEERIHHETSDINITGVLVFGAVLLGAALVIGFLVWLLFAYFSGREARRVTPQFPLAATQEQRLATLRTIAEALDKSGVGD